MHYYVAERSWTSCLQISLKSFARARYWPSGHPGRSSIILAVIADSPPFIEEHIAAETAEASAAAAGQPAKVARR